MVEDRFIQRLRRGARRVGLEDARVLLAVSGGPDSMALLLGLHELARPLGLTLEVATIDHQLREGSAADCAYVARACRKLGVPCTVARVVVGRQGGREAAARQARYAALQSIAEERRCDLVATGHTLEDQAETVLLRLARGTGTRGLRGILPRRGRVVRPMLDVPRAAVAAFLVSRRIRPRRDPTNLSVDFDRNRLRAQVLPALERALGPAALRSIARAAEAAREDERFLESKTRRLAARLLSASDGRIEGDARAIGRLHPALRRRLIRRAATSLGLRLSADHVSEIERVLASKSPARAGLPEGFEARCEYGRFTLARKARQSFEHFSQVIDGPGIFQIGRHQVRVSLVRRPGKAAPGSVRIDPSGVALPLLFRNRMAGDRFRPRGGHAKKLKAFLIDAKVPREERDRLPLLVDAEGRVLWVVGVRASDAAEQGERAAPAWSIRVSSSVERATSLERHSGGSSGAGRRAIRGPAGRGSKWPK